MIILRRGYNIIGILWHFSLVHVQAHITIRTETLLELKPAAINVVN